MCKFQPCFCFLQTFSISDRPSNFTCKRRNQHQRAQSVLGFHRCCGRKQPKFPKLGGLGFWPLSKHQRKQIGSNDSIGRDMLGFPTFTVSLSAPQEDLERNQHSSDALDSIMLDLSGMPKLWYFKRVVSCSTFFNLEMEGI